MTLTKIQIVESIQDQTGFPKNKSVDIVETLLEIIKSTLVSGEDVLISRRVSTISTDLFLGK